MQQVHPQNIAPKDSEAQHALGMRELVAQVYSPIGHPIDSAPGLSPGPARLLSFAKLPFRATMGTGASKGVARATLLVFLATSSGSSGLGSCALLHNVSACSLHRNEQAAGTRNAWPLGVRSVRTAKLAANGRQRVSATACTLLGVAECRSVRFSR